MLRGPAVRDPLRVVILDMLRMALRFTSPRPVLPLSERSMSRPA